MTQFFRPSVRPTVRLTVRPNLRGEQCIYTYILYFVFGYLGYLGNGVCGFWEFGVL